MKKKSIYKYAAEAGLPVGLYLTLMSACLLFSLNVSILPMFILPLAIGFPFVLYIVMKKISMAEPSYHKLSSLWLGGIYTVIFGTLICVWFSAMYMFFINPHFMSDYIMNVIQTVENSGMADEYASTITLMKDALEAGIYPTGLQLVTSLGWFTCFIGSILSLGLAFLLTKTVKKPSRQIG